MNKKTVLISLLLLASAGLAAQNECTEIPCATGIRQILTTAVLPEICTLESKLDTCCTTIGQDFRTTWTIIDAITNKPFTPCPCSATPISTPGTISAPGSYCLTQDLLLTPGQTGITINAADVTFDLNNHTISGGSNGVLITNAGAHATVVNGTIQNTSETGITIGSSGCQFASIDSIATPTGFLLENASENSISNCRALQNSFAGFSLVTSSTNNLTNCQALNQIGIGSVYGFYATNGTTNSFDFCIAAGCRTSSTTAGHHVAGFYATASQTNAIITNGVVTDIQSPTTNVPAYGIIALGTEQTIKNNSVKNVTSGGTAGVGIFANSNLNYVAQNTSCSNDLNYSLVDTLFLGSQANARGVDNVDYSLPNKSNVITTDFSGTYTTIAAIINENWSIESKCEVISDKITLIPAQLPIDQEITPPTSLMGTFTISQPGSYFLRADVSPTPTNPPTPAIVINASDVTLDLNGFTVYGTITIAAGLQNIAIKNGTLTNFSPAISLANGTSNIILTDLLFHFGLYDIQADPGSTINNIIIKNCRFIGYNNYGIDLSSATQINGLLVDNCYFKANVLNATDIAVSNGKHIEILNCQHIMQYQDTTGCLLSDCTNSVIRKCSYQMYQVPGSSNITGLTGISNSGCTKLHIQQCISENNTNTASSGIGFYLTACTDTTLSECKTIGNSNDGGFVFLTTGTAINLDRCVATNNNIGFQIESIDNITLERCLAEGNAGDGFYLNNSSGLVQECVAQGNVITGFNDGTGVASAIAYAANIARNNGTDYSSAGAPFNPVSYTSSPNYWKNVE